MTTEKIAAAAKEHALDMLGAEQFNHNKDARAAIVNDFKAGVRWAQKQAAANQIAQSEQVGK